MATGLEMFSQRRLQLLKEQQAGVFDPTAKPRLMHSLRSTYQNNEARDSLMPQGFNATAWNAILQQSAGINNTWKPDYGQMDILMEMLCGAPRVTDTSVPNQTTYTYALPLTGSRNITTYTGEFGKPDSAQQLLYSVLQQLDLTITRGNAPAIEGNANMLFLKPGRDDVRMSAGTNETQTVKITGADGGDFTLTLDGDKTDPIDYNATPAAVQAALESLGSVGAGNVLVSGTAGDYTIVFLGALASTAIATMTADDGGLTGSAPSISIAKTTTGAPGDWALDPRLPLLPQHFYVKKATELAELNNAVPLGTVHEIVITHSNLADPFMFFDEGKVTSDAHVDGGEQVHGLSIAMAYDTDGDCAAVKAAAMESPSRAEFWEVGARHPDGVHQWSAIGFYSVSEPVEHEAVGNVYACTFPMNLLINDDLKVDGESVVMLFKLTVAS